MVAKQQSRISHDINLPIFSALVGKVSTYALHKMANELARSRKSDFPRICTGTFTRTMGMPCGHLLHQRAESRLLINLNEVHRHWYFSPQDSQSSETPVLNPIPVETGRGRPRNVTSTRRNPSEFETIAARVRRQRARAADLESGVVVVQTEVPNATESELESESDELTEEMIVVRSGQAH